MIIKEHSFPCNTVPFVPNEHTSEQILYFDIETTGLSAASSYVYLIGCAHIQNKSLHLTQWLATEPCEEKELISLFLSHTKNFSCLIQFNGDAFDLPFLEKKCVRHCLPCSLSELVSVDYYKLLQPYKKILPLANLKLKTLSEYLQLPREDTFSGAELTTLYTAFIGKYKLGKLTGQTEEADALESVLLLHNTEDLTALPAIGTLIHTLYALAHTQHRVTDIHLQTDILLLTLYCTDCVLLPCSLRLAEQSATFNITCTADTITLSIPLWVGELKHFFSNYKDYFYLPLEDTAIHTSVASFVEKDYRKKATAATCYTRKEGTFFPIPSPVVSGLEENLPLFFTEYKNKLPYALLTKELITDTAFWQTYSNSVLSFLLAQKANKKIPASKINNEIN